MRTAASLLIGGLIVMVGCAQVQPTPTIGGSGRSTPSPSPSSRSDATASVTPSPTPTPIATAELTFHSIDQAFTTPALAYMTDGHALLWSSGAPNGEDAPGAANLWRYVPGSDEPELLYANPNQDSDLMALGGNGRDAYAFLEILHQEHVDDIGGWRLWLLPRPGAQTLLLDEAGVESSLPLFGMDREHVAWATWREVDGQRMSQLMVAEVATGEVTTLASRPLEEAFMWFPNIDDGKIVFSSTTTLDADTGAYDADVFMIDLAEPGAPQQLNGDELAYRPEIDGDTVVWQQPDPEFAAGNGGPLIAHSLSTGESRVIDFPSIDGRVIDQSVSGRWVTAQGADGPYTKLYLYDLVEHRAVLIDDTGDEVIDPPLVDVRPHVNGNLIAFIRGSNDPDAHLQLMWGELPQP